MEQKSNGRVRLSNGIIKQNMVLMSGLFAGPVIGAATTLENSLVLSLVFSLVTVVSVGLCRLLPKKIDFSVRIVLYALIASAVYVPVMLLAEIIFNPETVGSITLYLAIMVTNPFITAKTESRFFLRSVPLMFKDVIGFVLGFDLSCILVGSLRDILTDNMLWNTIIPLPFQLSAMESVYGGFILVGVLAGLCRFLYNKFEKRKGSR
ncbi:MAG: NADH:ubiquinone oxidoreductase subunit RnfE [Ruminococcaceae bacterium]|nr:NADH:ubiquinone oxidoreductase subunit RnfE [Oscillospiraceae bacterium]